MTKYRYTVQIQFKSQHIFMQSYNWDFEEPVKSLREAQQYKSMVDDTVSKAQIIDNISGKIIEKWM